VHTTLKKLCGELPAKRFLRLNRSLVVRSDFIERLLHDQRHWLVRLVDGSTYRIAKSRSAAIVASLKADSSLNDHPSPNKAELSDYPPPVPEKLMR
jgi:DNA-binding LytR/AlgR family response regulator